MIKPELICSFIFSGTVLSALKGVVFFENPFLGYTILRKIIHFIAAGGGIVPVSLRAEAPVFPLRAVIGTALKARSLIRKGFSPGSSLGKRRTRKAGIPLP